MRIEDFLSPDNTLIDVKAPNKPSLLQELAARAAENLKLSDKRIAQELMKREDLGTTGMGAGIAIPHARIPGLHQPFGMLVRLRKPIDYQAIDGRPVDVVFLLLQSASAPGDLAALAAVARRLREPERLQRLRKTEDAQALHLEFARPEASRQT